MNSLKIKSAIVFGFSLLICSGLASAEVLNQNGNIEKVWPEYRQITISGVTYTVSPSVDFVNEDMADGVQGLKELADLIGEVVDFQYYEDKEETYITSITVSE